MESPVLAGNQKIPTLHHPEGIDPDQMFFQESKVHELMLSSQRDSDPQTWQAIVMGCLPLIDSLIRKHGFQLYEDQNAPQRVHSTRAPAKAEPNCQRN